jgi:hypothetical protein
MFYSRLLYIGDKMFTLHNKNPDPRWHAHRYLCAQLQQQASDKPALIKSLMKLQTSLQATLATLVLPICLHSAELMPNFADVPNGWVTDRYAPTSFSNIGPYQGRGDVLGIEITSAGNLANRPGGYQTSFYNTQGMKHAISGGSGSTLSADLWIDGAWQTSSSGSIRTDVWGVMVNNVPTVTAYPILGFTNYGGTARFRYYDGDIAGGWTDVGAPILYNSWNTLSIGFTGSAFVFSVNGSVVGSDTTINNSTGFSAAIMQAYNFSDPSISGATPVDYTAHWSNTPVPDVHNTIALLSMSLATVFGLRRRFGS